jgi:transcription initiation factor IIF auxiliary subunit
MNAMFRASANAVLMAAAKGERPHTTSRTRLVVFLLFSRPLHTSKRNSGLDMAATRQRVASILRLLVALAVGAVPCVAVPRISNTSTYVGAGRWDWTIFLDADLNTLQQIDGVEYTLHPTFPNPVRKVCNQPETKFALSSNDWGTFTVKLRIQYKNGRVEDAEHQLIFKQETTPTQLNVTVENWSKQIEPGWWEWGIYLKGPPTELKRIRCVEYTLHPSFPNPVRLVCSPDKGFLLTARG